MPQVVQIDAFVGFTLAIVLLFVDKGLSSRVVVLRRYGIPSRWWAASCVRRWSACCTTGPACRAAWV